MSLFAASTASRHLRHHLLSNVINATTASSTHNLRIGGGKISTSSAVTRHFSSTNGAKGSGLRRTQTKGRPVRQTKSSQQKAAATTDASSSSSASSTAAKQQQQQQQQHRGDPHFIANEMVSKAFTEGRTPGTESVATLTKEQKISNFAMAGGLLAFVSYIFYYSLASVGGTESAKALLFGGDNPNDATQQQQEGGEGTSNPGFEEFLKEANEGRSVEEKRMQAEQEARGEARELAELESSTAARLKAEGVGDDVIVAGSANEEEEREMARVAGFGDVEGEETTVKKRALWKRVVFFWRRE